MHRVRRCLSWAKWIAVQYGYVVRPFDMLADRRRWFWQPRTPCGGLLFLDEEIDAWR